MEGEGKGSLLRRIPSLQSALVNDLIDLISDFCQCNRFQCVQTVDFELPLRTSGMSDVQVSSSTGQIFVSIGWKIIIYDRRQGQQRHQRQPGITILIPDNVKTYNSSIGFCVDGDELFVVDHWNSQIQVFSIFSIVYGNNDGNKPQRNLPIEGNPCAIAVHNSILIVTVHINRAGFVCAMTPRGKMLWITADRTFSLYVFNECGIFIDKVTDEILIYSILGFFIKIFDFTSGKEIPGFENWGMERSEKYRGALTINAQNEILLCSRTAGRINILKFSRDDVFIEARPLSIPVENMNESFPTTPGFCAGQHGELIIYDCGKLHIIK